MKAGGGELNFATADDKMAMTVFVPPEFMYALWEKQYPGIAIAGLGGEAFSMGAWGSPPSFVFCKGRTGVWFQSLKHKSSYGWLTLRPKPAQAQSNHGAC